MPTAVRGLSIRFGASVLLFAGVLSCNPAPTDPDGQPLAFAKAASVLQRAQGLGASVQLVEGRHWVAGESAVGGKWRATLWRIP